MAVARIAAQHIDQRGPHTHTALLRQLQLCGDQIGLREFHKKRFSAQKIRILRQRLYGFWAKRPKHIHGLLGRNAILRQPRHHLTHAEHAPKLAGDRIGLVGGDALHLGKSCGLLGNDLQNIRAEMLHQLFGRSRAHIGQRTAAQIGQRGLFVLRHTGLARLHLKLLAVCGVGFHPAVGHDAFPHIHFAHAAGRHHVIIARAHFHHAVARIAIFVNQTIYGSFQLLQFPVHGSVFPPGLLMAFIIVL